MHIYIYKLRSILSSSSIKRDNLIRNVHREICRLSSDSFDIRTRYSSFPHQRSDPSDSIREEKRREKISLNRNWRSTDGQAGNKVLSCTRYYWTREEGRLRVIDGNATNSTDIPMA